MWMCLGVHGVNSIGKLIQYCTRGIFREGYYTFLETLTKMKLREKLYYKQYDNIIIDTTFWIRENKTFTNAYFEISWKSVPCENNPVYNSLL